MTDQQSDHHSDIWPTWTEPLKQALTHARTAWWCFDLTATTMIWGNPSALRVWRKKDLETFTSTDYKTDMSPSAKARLLRIETTLRNGEEVTEQWTFYPESQGKRVAVTVDCHMNGINLPHGNFGFLCEGVERASTDEASSPNPPTTTTEEEHSDHAESSKSNSAESRQQIESDNLRMIESYRHAPYGILLLAMKPAHDGLPARLSTVSANPEVTAAFGVHADFWNSFSNTSDREEIYQQLMVRGEWAGEVMLLSLKGSKWFRIDAKSMNDPVTAGKLILLYLVDISRTKKLEGDLVKAREQADSGNRAKSDFLAIISHEIRTPLNSICGMTTLLLDTERTLSADQRKSLSLIRSSGDALLAILEDVLDFSRIESGKLELHLESFKIRACVEDTLDLFRSQMVKGSISVSYHVHPDVAESILSDEKRLRQCIWNLLANSMKFTPQGGHIWVEVVPTDVVENGIQFSVRDTGIGIPKEKQGVIFSHFAQADTGTSRRFGGSGLGLALVRKLTELLGGRVWLEESIPGQGSMFVFVISARPGPELWVEPVEATKDKTFVVVHKDEVTRKHLSSVSVRNLGMKELGCGVAFPNQEADIVYLDLDLIEMARSLKRDWPNSHIIVTCPLSGQNPAITFLQPNMFMDQLVKRHPEYRDIVIDGHIFVPFKISTLAEVVSDTIYPRRRINSEENVIQALEQLKAPSKSVTLPRRRDHVTPTAPPSTFDDTIGHLFPLRILCVDDNDVNLLLVKRFLQKMNFSTVDAAKDGRLAVEKVCDIVDEKIPYDLILTDINMPEVDGITACKQILEFCQNHKVVAPVIVGITADISEAIKARCINAGMRTAITKPIRVAQLQDMLIEVGKFIHGEVVNGTEK